MVCPLEEAYVVCSAVYLESCGMQVDWVSYFIDPTYRPNPDDYQVETWPSASAI